MIVTILLTTAMLAVSPLASTAMAATQDEVSRVADELTSGGGGSRKQGLNEQELRIVADELTQQNGGQPLDQDTLELHLRLVDEIVKRQPSRIDGRPSESQLRRVTADITQRNLERELRTPEDVDRVADLLTQGGTAKVGQFLTDQELLIVEDELIEHNGGQPLDPNDRENLLALADEIFKRQPSNTGTRPSGSRLRSVAVQLAQSDAAERFSDGSPDAASRVAAEAAADGSAVAGDQPDAGGEGVFTRVGRFFGGLFS
jgi:hypothetical protein